MLAALLNDARAVEINDRELTLAFPPGAAFLKRKAEQDDHRRVAGEAFRKVMGQSLALRYELREVEETPAATNGERTLSGEELVRRFLEEFDAEEILDDELETETEPPRGPSRAEATTRNATTAEHAADAQAGPEDAAGHDGRAGARSKDEVIDASAGSGAWSPSKLTGDLHVKAITIDPSGINPDDVELLQDMVLAAVNEGLRSAQELAESKLGGIAGGLGGPGGLGGLGCLICAETAQRRPRRRARCG